MTAAEILALIEACDLEITRQRMRRAELVRLLATRKRLDARVAEFDAKTREKN